MERVPGEPSAWYSRSLEHREAADGLRQRGDAGAIAAGFVNRPPSTSSSTQARSPQSDALPEKVTPSR